jgi:hypothetical protein
MQRAAAAVQAVVSDGGQRRAALLLEVAGRVDLLKLAVAEQVARSHLSHLLVASDIVGRRHAGRRHDELDQRLVLAACHLAGRIQAQQAGAALGDAQDLADCLPSSFTLLLIGSYEVIQRREYRPGGAA